MGRTPSREQDRALRAMNDHSRIDHPYACGLDGAWHQRPAGDEWRPRPADTQCSTICGRRIASDKVSAVHPLRMKCGPREWVCGACFR